MSTTYFWDSLIDEQALGELFPSSQSRLARPIRDSLALFLDGLPVRHQCAIMAAQTALPANASISVRLGALARCCPVLHKLGQILARDERIAAELRDELRELESLPPSVEYSTIEQSLEQQLGPLDRLNVTLSPPAIAEASVAVVIPYREHSERGVQRGVFKVLKPDIEERLALELSLLERVGGHLDECCHELELPHLDYEQTFQQVKHRLLGEICLRQEQRHLAAARDFYADDRQVLIPELYPHCTDRVTAMERVSGVKVADHALTDRRDRQRLAGLVARSLIAKPIFAAADPAVFHADPHAGNLLYTADGRLAILDWSVVGELPAADRSALVQLLLAAATLRADRVGELLAGLAQRGSIDRAALARVVASGLRRIRQGQLPGFAWLVALLDDAVQTARLRMGSDMLLFRKALHTLEGVIAAIGPSAGPGSALAQLDAVLLGEFVKQFAVEWPLRWTAPLTSREFATRLSNCDLLHAWSSAPSAAARFWWGKSRDALTVGGPAP